MKVQLVEIGGVDPEWESRWTIRALVIDGKDPVQVTLADWMKHSPTDYKAIMKVIRLAAQEERVRNEKHVKKSANVDHGDVYEMIAFTGVCRLMFFYDNRHESLIICTNPYKKGRGSQNSAFQRCADLRNLYLKFYP